MNLITTAAGNHLDLHTMQGRYEYVGEFLNKHAANSDVWKCLTELRARIAELEAAQQWHPASEPPEDLRHILILTKYNGWVKGNYRDVYAPSVRWWYSSCNVPINIEHVLGWRDLPPMPERREESD